MATRCAWPPDSSRGSRPANRLASMPTRCMISATRRRLSARSVTPAVMSGSVMDRATVQRGSSAPNGSWNTIWMPGLAGPRGLRVPPDGQ